MKKLLLLPILSFVTLQINSQASYGQPCDIDTHCKDPYACDNWGSSKCQCPGNGDAWGNSGAVTASTGVIGCRNTATGSSANFNASCGTSTACAVPFECYGNSLFENGLCNCTGNSVLDVPSGSCIQKTSGLGAKLDSSKKYVIPYKGPVNKALAKTKK